MAIRICDDAELRLAGAKLTTGRDSAEIRYLVERDGGSDRMKVTFYAHASFRLETPELAVIIDPYTPGASGFDPIDEPADLVIMSSATDRFHSDPSHVRGQPRVINALLDVPPPGLTVRDVPIRAFPTSESLTFDFGRDPDANAMYLFTIGGVRVLHMGDLGNAVAPAMLEALAGQVVVILALTGGHATIALDDLDRAIEVIAPRIVVPMHYWHPRGVLKTDPVERSCSVMPRQGSPALAERP